MVILSTLQSRHRQRFLVAHEVHLVVQLYSFSRVGRVAVAQSRLTQSALTRIAFSDFFVDLDLLFKDLYTRLAELRLRLQQ